MYRKHLGSSRILFRHGNIVVYLVLRCLNSSRVCWEGNLLILYFSSHDGFACSSSRIYDVGIQNRVEPRPYDSRKPRRDVVCLLPCYRFRQQACRERRKRDHETLSRLIMLVFDSICTYTHSLFMSMDEVMPKTRSAQSPTSLA